MFHHDRLLHALPILAGVCAYGLFALLMSAGLHGTMGPHLV